MRMSDHKHFDTILPFLQLHDVPHRIDLTIADIEAMHTAAGRDVEFLHPTSLVYFRSRSPLDSVSASPFVSDPSLADSGEISQNVGVTRTFQKLFRLYSLVDWITLILSGDKSHKSRICKHK